MSAQIDMHPVMASDVFNGFSLLEADAGTGKTWTLANLVVRALLERQVPIDQIAVVTFTNKAAAELRERVMRAITDLQAALAGQPSDDPFVSHYAQRCNPARDLPLLQQASALFDEAPISTIHGFCQRLLAEHSLSLARAIAPELRDVDAAFIEAACERWWRLRLASETPWLIGLLAATGNSPAMLAQGLLRMWIDPDRMLMPRPVDWRSFAHEVQAQTRLALAQWDAEHEAIAQWLATSSGVVRKTYRSNLVGGWLEKIGAWLDQMPIGLVPADKSSLALGIERLSASGFAEIHDGAVRMPFKLPVVLDCLRELIARAPGMRVDLLVSLYPEIAERVRARKRDEQVQSYDDLLIETHRALTEPDGGSALAARLRQRYPVIFVDECQDTDPLQWAILRRLHEPSFAADGQHSGLSLVMVGDPKQSIYSFRHADVFAYLAARGFAHRRLRLGENQRASAELIAGLNLLFDVEQAFVLPEINYTAASVGARMRAGWQQGASPDGRAALNFVELTASDDQSLSVANCTELALAAMANEVSMLLRGDVGRIESAAEPDGARRVRARDIAVLVRTAQEGALAKRCLSAAGIGAVEITRERVYDTLDARELLRIVDAIAQPSSAAAVRSALLTGLIGFDLSDLQAHASHPARWARLMEQFVDAARRWQRLGPMAALRHLLFMDLAIADRLSADPAAERRLTNLLQLIELIGASPLAREEPVHGRHMLSGAIQDELSGVGSESELRLESDADLVQILTMHKSKGLEFPIVMIPFAWYGRRVQGEPYQHAHVPDSAGGWNAVLICGQAGATDDETDRLRQRAALESQAEAARLLYVSCTRAELRLYLFWTQSAAGAMGALAHLLGKDPAARVQRMFDASPNAVGVLHGADLRGVPSGPGRAAMVASLTPARFAGTVPRPWVNRSFTGLMRAMRTGADEPASDAADADHDELADQVSPDEAAQRLLPPVSDAGLPIRHQFVAGARAGVALHEMLEQADFSQAISPQRVALSLQRHGLSAPADELAGWLDAVLDTPLQPPQGNAIRLRELEQQSMRHELGFSMPVHAQMAQARSSLILEIVRAEYPVAGILADDRDWHGYLKGFIDLVFEHDGRYWVLDWKSNRLGDDDAAYSLSTIETEIAQHGYALQFCLYTLALHRLLRWRLPDYSYDTHVGGVFYAFIRAMAGPGVSRGAYFARPSSALINALDAQFAGTQDPQA